MKNSNSFAFKTFFEQWLPRLIALSVFVYLVYSLLFIQDVFSWLHIIALVIVMALILAPMASRLKVLNLIDFNSKLSELKQEQQDTKNQLSEIRNQMSTFVSMGMSPIQHQTTIITGLEKLISKSQSETDVLPLEEGAKYTKEKFLQRAYSYCSRAYVLLNLTMSFQIAMREHREATEADYIKGDTVDERIPELIKMILDDGLDTVFPIKLIDKKTGETESAFTPEIADNLKLMNSLIELSKKIESDEVELPSRLDINSLFDKIGDALSSIAAGIEVIGTQSILYQYRVMSAIESIKKEIDQADIEQRPIRFPPPKSD